MLNECLLQELRVITEEEQAILDGRTTIDRDLYMQGQPDVVNSKKLLSAGKLITLQTNTRFIHFPKHTHDYVEMVYGCAGTVEHIVNGKAIRLKQGELLFLGQKATHEVCRAGREDIKVHESANGGGKTADKAIGRTRGGLNTKLHAIVDGLGNPVEFMLSAGNDHDSVHAHS